MPLARRARETSAAASSIGPAAPCGRSSTYAAWTFGMMSTCPSFIGWMSKKASRVDFHRGLRDHLADELEVADRPAERLALFDVFRRGLQGGTGHADGSGRDADSTAIERPHGLVPPVPFLSDQVVLRDAAILEGEVCGWACP